MLARNVRKPEERKVRKLVLKKETLRRAQEAELKEVVGGKNLSGGDAATCHCTYTC